MAGNETQEKPTKQEQKPKQKTLEEMTLGEIITEMFTVHMVLEQTANNLKAAVADEYMSLDNPEYIRTLVKSDERLKQKYTNLKTELDRKERQYNNHITYNDIRNKFYRAMGLPQIVFGPGPRQT